MRHHTLPTPVAPVALALLLAAPAAAQTGPPTPEAARQAAHARALAEIGRSGLRSLLSASGNLGDLQNRAGSYRMAAQLERARTAALEGRVAALEQTLADPSLPAQERTALTELRDAARDALASVPRYEAAYRAVTTQAEALMPFGFVGNRPIFLLLRARGHVRWGGADDLTVFSEGASVGPVVVSSNYRWIVSPGLSLGRTDVEIGPFDGRSGSTSAGPRLELGGILGPGWSVAAQLAHVWSRGGSTIVRPGPAGGTEVSSAGWSQTTSAKAELKGRISLAKSAGARFSLQPRIGAFLISTRSPPVTNSLGERGTGPFGERETVAALRAGGSFETRFGPWGPSLYLGWEHELTDQMSTLIDDPQAFLARVGVSRSWGRGRRLLVDYSLLQGFNGLRQVSELTLVLILDG